ncbi:MAG: hypothetical protein WBA99_14295 [Nodosilinea sp.]
MFRPSISLAGLVCLGFLTGLPAQAHKTEVSGNVAGTWHLEPDHSARTGEPARVWVALTQQGGRVIPLEQCDCNLAVYRASQPDSAPVMQPTLTAMSPERFENVPGAEITFPEVGKYRIVLTGSPTAGATFTPFELSYTAVAAGGTETTTPPQPAENQNDIAPSISSPDKPGDRRFLWIAIAVGGVGLAIAALLVLRQQKLSHPKDSDPGQ